LSLNPPAYLYPSDLLYHQHHLLYFVEHEPLALHPFDAANLLVLQPLQQPLDPYQ
jgi:hypothetical protein